MIKTITILLKNNQLLLGFALLVTLFLSLRVGRVEMREDEETFISAKSPVLEEYREFQKLFDSNEGIVVAYESTGIFQPEELAFLEHLHKRLEKLPGVKEVKSLLNADNVSGVYDGIEISPVVQGLSIKERDPENVVKGNPLFEGVFISSDMRVTALMVDLPGMFNGGSDSLHKEFYEELERLIIEEEGVSGRRIYAGGDIITDASVEKLMDKDLSLLFPVSLLLAAVILLLFFRKILTTVVPLIPVVVAIIWVLGLKGWSGIPLTPVSVTLFPLITVIGLANSIHIISHYQRIRPFEATGYDASFKTLLAVLKPCFLVAFTTAVGFGSLAVSNVTGIKQLGLFAAFGIISAFFLSVIFIPFSLQRSRLFTNPYIGKSSNQSLLLPLLGIIDALNQKHGDKVVVIFVVVTILMGCFIPAIRTEGSMSLFARETTRLRQDIDFLDENMSGINSFELLIKGGEDAFSHPDNLEKLEEIARKLKSESGVLKVFSIADLVKIINKALHSDNPDSYKIPESQFEIAQYLFLYEISGGDVLSDFTDETYTISRLTIRTNQLPDARQKEFITLLETLAAEYFPGFDITITGSGILMNHVNENLISTQVESVMIALGIILLLMFIMFGFKGGMLSILPNMFPLIVFMGLMGLSGIHLNMATSIIAAVTIGIVVDDTIHFFFGYKKEMMHLNNPSLAVSATIISVGQALAITSLVLTLGFGIMIFSSSKFVGDFGIMSASAIAAALLGDLFISPVILKKSRLFKINR